MWERFIRLRPLCAIAVMLAIVAFAAACSSDSDTEPLPAAEPPAAAEAQAEPEERPTPEGAADEQQVAEEEPAAAEESAAEEEPAAEEEQAVAEAPAEPVAALEDFVVTESTTGQDLTDALSEAEVSCMKAAFGDAVFGAILGTPLLLAAGDASAAAPLFECLEIESVVYVGFAFIEAQAGGWSPDTRGCMIGVGLEYPDAFRVGMGLLPIDDAAAAMATHPYLVDLYHCMTEPEQVAYLLNFQEVIDLLTTAEHDLIGAIPAADAACIRDALTDAEYETLLAGTVHQAFDISDAVAGCMSEDAYVQSFVAISDTTVGDLSDDTKACLTEFARGHPHYTALINAHAYDPPEERTEELAEIARDGLKTWACMTAEEIQRSQGISTRALGGAPAPPPPPARPTQDPAPAAGMIGQDIMAALSESEVRCLHDALGAAAYEAFLDADLATAYRDARDLEPLWGCLTGENFVHFGMTYVSARGGLVAESHTCLLELGREHPDAVVTILGIETAPEAVAALTVATHNYVVELYQCLTVEEQVQLTVHMWGGELGTYELTPQELMAAFTEEEITCFTDSFGITREQLESLVGSRQPGQTSSEATPCLTADTYARILIAGLSPQVGGLTDESASCIRAFANEHPHFLEVARVGAFDASSMSESEFAEISADGFQVLDCLTDDELKAIQEVAARALGSFRRAGDS